MGKDEIGEGKGNLRSKAYEGGLGGKKNQRLKTEKEKHLAKRFVMV
ncbi:MAG TPA: hypothetical protein G4N91_03295 [Dehalococcoidia bacterium]|nr:hypothetical protein [Dehalococcoidia bacterium]